MRKFVLLVAGLAMGAVVRSQCPTYYPVTAGETMEMTNYDKKGKETGKSQTTVQNVTGNTIDLLSKNIDDKGEEVSSVEFTVTCEADALKIDMRRFMSPESTAAWEGMENVTFEIEGDMLELPNNLTVGQHLPDGNMTLRVFVSGSPMFTTTVSVTNRMVEAVEDVTTPLGTFSCTKLTYDVATKMLFNIKGKGAEWLSTERGLIKTESYNDSGKLQGSSLRTA